MYNVSKDFLKAISEDFVIGQNLPGTPGQLISVSIVDDTMIKAQYFGSKKYYYYSFDSVQRHFLES